MIKLSVIIPIYKVEEYIHKCVDSVLNQTYTNLEIILVDDGSPDNCGNICDEYAQKDNRVVVVHKKNGGLSDARNAGLDIATGEYIAFIDSDDWLELDAYEYLVKKAEQHNVMMAVGGVKVYDEKYEKYRKDYEVVQVKEEIKTKSDYIKQIFLGIWSAWDKIYHKSLFDNIRFPKGEFNEDEAIMLQNIDKCERVFVSNKPIYVHYVRTNESITAAKFHIKKMAWYEHCKANLEFIKEKYPELTKYAEYRYFSSLIWCLNNMTANTNEFTEHIRLLRQEMVKKLRCFLSNNYISKKEKIRGIMLAYLYNLYVVVVKIMKKQYT